MLITCKNKIHKLTLKNILQTLWDEKTLMITSTLSNEISMEENREDENMMKVINISTFLKNLMFLAFL